jgi:2-amino-4-hydroxy-6-hydroxymethyldihydropteridine diphosphokinase
VMPLSESKNKTHFPGNNVEIIGETVVLSIGSNMGDRELNIQNAVKALETAGVIDIKISSFYETEPVGYTEQDEFLNIAAIGQTLLSPQELLSTIQSIENSMARKREIRWGPRPIDIDIVFFGGRIINEPGLSVPHPEYKKRAFVIMPILEITPDFKDLQGVPLKHYLTQPEVASQRVVRLTRKIKRGL